MDWAKPRPFLIEFYVIGSQIEHANRVLDTREGVRPSFVPSHVSRSGGQSCRYCAPGGKMESTVVPVLRSGLRVCASARMVGKGFT